MYNKFIDIQLHKKQNKEKNSAILVFTRKWKSDLRRKSNQNHEENQSLNMLKWSEILY